MVNLPGPVVDRATRDFLAEQCPGGVILFKRNIRSPEQLGRLVTDIHAAGAGVPPLVALDHEGGRVDRLPHPPFTHFPPMATVAERGDAKLAVAVGRAMGRELRAVGIDLDFAPVLDVWSNPRNRVIGDRAFGTTPQAVARFALAFARGLAQAGVLACGKHFPGHGATVGDSHFVLPRVRRSRREFAAVDLLPFARAAAACIPALMTAHAVAAARQGPSGLAAGRAAGPLAGARVSACLVRDAGVKLRVAPPPGGATSGWPAAAPLGRPRPAAGAGRGAGSPTPGLRAARAGVC